MPKLRWASSGLVLLVLAALLAGCAQPKLPKFGLAGGLLGSARTDVGLGLGWTVSAGMRYPSMPFFDMVSLRLEVCRVTYEEEEVNVTRIALGAMVQVRPQVFGLGGAVHFADNNSWGAGPRICYGFGVFEERYEYYLLTSGYAWLGARNDEFGAGAEADLRLCAGARF